MAQRASLGQLGGELVGVDAVEVIPGETLVPGCSIMCGHDETRHVRRTAPVPPAGALRRLRPSVTISAIYHCIYITAYNAVRSLNPWFRLGPRTYAAPDELGEEYTLGHRA